MRFSVEWLSEYVQFPWTPTQLADQLTEVGLEVESVNPVALGLEKVIVGEVTDLKPHSEVSQWKVCQVLLGDCSVSLICGAPNVKVGMKVAVALPGTKLLSGIEVQEKTLRGVASKGMLCSEAELGLGMDASGLLSLPSPARPGASLEEVLGRVDFALEVKVTPNRPDCLSVIGIAREVAAILGKKVQLSRFRLLEKGEKVEKLAGLRVNSSKDCPRYLGRVVTNVAIHSSPIWMIRRLKAVGLRPINNAVDITNYVLWETGHPLHAFDLDRLEGRRVIVRRALAGEKMSTLDETERPLDSDILVIADTKAPVALAGIMGGLHSEVTEKTKNIFLESAWFDSGLIRRGSKRLGLRTEASYRFERGADPEAASYASQRASQMMVDLAGGILAKGCLDKYPKPFKPLMLPLRHARVEFVLGETLTAGQVKRTLGRLSLEAKTGKDAYCVRVPSFRSDLTREIDLIEEVARGYGYHRFKGKFSTRGGYSGAILPEERIEDDLRALLTGFGFVEILSPSITRRAALEGALLSDGIVPLRNPLSEEMAVLRPSLLPGVLEVIARNFSFGARALRIFEVGKTFCLDHNGRATERVALGIALAGDARPPQFGDSVRTVDLFDLKGVLEAILKRFSLRQAVMASDNALSFLDNGGCLSLGGVRLGCLGKVKGSVAEYFNIRKEVYFSEIEIEPLNQASIRPLVVASISRFPSVERDISIVVSEDIPWAAIERSVRAVGGELLEELNLFDVFRHERIGLNRKALGISLRFRAANRTLSAEEVEEKQAACLTRLSEAFGATLRG